MKTKLLILFISACFLEFSVFAEISEREYDAATLSKEAEFFFHEANEYPPEQSKDAFEAYGKAAARYEKILSDGLCDNGPLHYNLGNVYFRMRDYGRAILHYRRAERFIPNDPKLQQNLATARLQRQDNFAVPERTRILKTLFFWHYDFSPSLRQNLAIIFSLCFWLLAAILLWKRHVALWAIVSLFLLLASAALVSLGIDAWQISHNRPAVIIAERVTARIGDGSSYAPAFNGELHAGTELNILNTRGAWSEIRLADGKTAWLPNDSLESVKQ